jgi:hypothetical protein
VHQVIIAVAAPALRGIQLGFDIDSKDKGQNLAAPSQLGEITLIGIGTQSPEGDAADSSDFARIRRIQ